VWRYHANNFLPADISRCSLGDEELLKLGEGLVPANNLLMRLHVPDQLVRESWHRLGRLHWLAFKLDGSNPGYVTLLEDLTHSKSVGLGSREAEAVREISSHVLPHSVKFLLFQEASLAIVCLVQLIFALDVRPGLCTAKVSVVAAVLAFTAKVAASASAPATLQRSVQCDSETQENLTRPRPISTGF
jgi:hypothetical protein